MSEKQRVYRFAPLDRTGLLLGMSGAQVALIAAGILASGLLLDAAVPPLDALVPIATLSAAAFARWNGRPLHEWAPVLALFVGLKTARRRRCVAAITLIAGTPLGEGR